MPKRQVSITLGPWTGGYNSIASSSEFPLTDLRGGEDQSLNITFDNPKGAAGIDVGVDFPYGTGVICRRPGTRRAHSAVIGTGNPILGVTQWDAPSVGKQIVAISNGRLYHRTGAIINGGSFTEVIPTAGDEFSTTTQTYFQPFRGSAAGAPLRLFMASGNKVYHWTGSTLTRIDGTNGVPRASLLAAKNVRMFYNDNDPTNPRKKHVVWSAIGDATQVTTGGGSAMVDVLTGEAISALKPVGGSLIIATETSLSRFTGYSDDDIRIAQDTEGVSDSLGTWAGSSLTALEGVLYAVGKQSIFAASEGGTQDVSQKFSHRFREIQPWSSTAIPLAVPFLEQRRVLFIARHSSNGDTIFVLDTRFPLWEEWRPFTFTTTSVGLGYESDGFERVLLGGTDGFIRHFYLGNDDQAFDGSGGSAFFGVAELAPFFFGAADTEVIINRAYVYHRDNTVTMNIQHDNVTVGTIPAVATTGRPYVSRVDLTEARGRVFRFRINSIPSGAEIQKIVFEGYDTGRRVVGTS